MTISGPIKPLSIGPADVAPPANRTAEKSAVLDLAYEEYCCRMEAGSPPSVEEFCARFPACRSSLRRLLAAHHFLAEQANLLDEAAPARWPAPGEQWGDYTLRRELGRGAFARVYLATEASTGDRLVALKLSAAASAEARTLGPLNHPNVVPILSARDEGGLFAVCMPFLGAATLTDVLDRAYAAPTSRPPRRAAAILDAVRETARPGDPVVGSTLPDRRLTHGSWEDGVAWLGVELADALAFLHEHGVYHRDLKPSNVLLTGGGRPLLLDFNLSTAGCDAMPRLGGTLPYMAPEQVRVLFQGHAVASLDGRADLFSLGVILYELLTGQPPFGPLPFELPREELAAVCYRALQNGCRPLRNANRTVPRRLAAIVEGCLSFDRERRPASAQELAAALRRALRAAGQRWLAGWCCSALLGTAILGAAVAAHRADAYDRGRAAIAAGDLVAASRHFDYAMSINPGDGRARSARAWARAKLSESVSQAEGRVLLPLALEGFRSTDGAAASPATQACLGYCLSRMAGHAEAILCYNAAEAAGMRTAALYNDRAYSRLCRNELDEAAADLAEALRIDPELGAAFHNRAVLGFMRWARSDGRGSPAAALADTEKALQLGLRSSALFVDAARLLAVADGPNRHGEAIAYLLEATALGQDPAPLLTDPYLRPLFDDRRDLAQDLKQPSLRQPAAGSSRLILPGIEMLD